MTEAEATGLWAALAAAYWNPPPPDATRLLYVEELQQLGDVELAAAAVRALIREPRSFMPTIGEIWGAYWHQQKRAREEREREARGRALPEGDRLPIAPEVLAELSRLGIDVGRLTKPIDPNGKKEAA
jgi:hypothetical protein